MEVVWVGSRQVLVVALYSRLVVVVVVQGSPPAVVAVVVPDSRPAVAVVAPDNHPVVVVAVLDNQFDDAVVVVVVAGLCNCSEVVDQDTVLFYRRNEEEAVEGSQMFQSCQNFPTDEFALVVDGGSEICSQFHQHFKSSFFANLLPPKYTG